MTELERGAVETTEKKSESDLGEYTKKAAETGKDQSAETLGKEM